MLISIALLLLNTYSFAQATFDGSTSSNWNTATNWSTNIVPGSNDDVIIPNGLSVVINTNAVCKSLTFGTGNTNTTISFSSSSQSLYIENNLTFETVTSGSGTRTHLINISTASINCGSIVMANNSSGEVSRISVSTGSLIVRGDISMNGSTNENYIDYSNSGIFKISGSFTQNGTFTPSTSTVEYNGTATQNVRSATYNNFIISGSGIKTLTGNTNINGTLTLTAGSLAINGNTLTINGAVSTTSGNIRGSSTSKLTIAGAAAAASLSFDQTDQASRSLSNLTNTRANGITIANALEIIDSINVSNGTISSGGNITLVSTATNTARVARISNGGFSGNIVAQRFIPGGAGKRRWRFLSSPVNTGIGGIQLNQYIDDIHVTGMGGSGNGFDDCSCNPSIRFYNETINAIADSGWRNPSSINYQVNTGSAVEVFVRGSRNTPDPFLGTSVPDNATIDYIGEINSGTVNINLSFTDNGLTSSDGFNLVGNPYPSQIDWMATGWTKTNIDRFFWSYDPRSTTPVYGVFDPNSEIGTNGVTRYIPSGIGFFVKANNTGAALGFTETIKSNQAPYNFFKGNSSPSSKFPYIKINAGDSLMNDDAVLLFDTSASSSANDLSDVMKLFNPSINFYSKSKENKNLALNQIDFPSTKEDTINFSMFVYENSTVRIGAYNIYLKEIVDIPTWLGIDILDKYTNTRVDIKNSAYNFNIENITGAHGNNRFAIILYRKTTGIENISKLYRLYPNPAQNTIHISNFNNNIQNIKIYDLKSSLIKEINQINANIDVSELINGIYLISIESDKGIEIHKFIINK